MIPQTVSVNPTTSSLNWVYAYNDVHFGQSVTVRSPVYANRDLWRREHGDDRRDDPAERRHRRRAEQGRGRTRPLADQPAEQDRARLREREPREPSRRDLRPEQVLEQEPDRPALPLLLGSGRRRLGRHHRNDHPTRVHHRAEADLLRAVRRLDRPRRSR